MLDDKHTFAVFAIDDQVTGTGFSSGTDTSEFRCISGGSEFDSSVNGERTTVFEVTGIGFQQAACIYNDFSGSIGKSPEVNRLIAAVAVGEIKFTIDNNLRLFTISVPLIVRSGETVDSQDLDLGIVSDGNVSENVDDTVDNGITFTGSSDRNILYRTKHSVGFIIAVSGCQNDFIGRFRQHEQITPVSVGIHAGGIKFAESIHSDDVTVNNCVIGKTDILVVKIDRSRIDIVDGKVIAALDEVVTGFRSQHLDRIIAHDIGDGISDAADGDVDLGSIKRTVYGNVDQCVCRTGQLFIDIDVDDTVFTEVQRSSGNGSGDIKIDNIVVVQRFDNQVGISDGNGTIVVDRAVFLIENRVIDVQLGIGGNGNRSLDVKFRAGKDIDHTGLADLERTAVGTAAVMIDFIIGSILDNQMSGSAGTVVAGNVGVENQRVNIVESRRSVDEQVSAVERIIETGIHIFDIRITGDIQNTVIGDVQITEFSNRIIDVESVTTIGHCFSFFRIGIVITGTDPTTVSNVIRADIRVVLHGDSDTVFSINSVIAAHVRADTDLEVGGIDAGPVKDVISGGETDFSAFDIGLVTESDVVHVNPGFTAESFDGKIAFSGDNEHGFSVLQSDRIGRKLRVVDVEPGSSVPLTAVVAIVNRTGINDGVVCSEGRSFNQQIIGIDVRCGTVGISIAVDGKGGKADLNASDRKGSGALDSVVAVEEISATPILTAGDSTFDMERRSIVDIETACIVVDFKGDVFINGDVVVKALSKYPIRTEDSLSDRHRSIGGKDDIAFSVLEFDDLFRRYIAEQLDRGIAAVNSDLVHDVAQARKGIHAEDLAGFDHVTGLFVSPGSVDIQGILTGIGDRYVTVFAVDSGNTFAFDGDFASQRFSTGKVDDFIGTAETISINGDRGIIAHGNNISSQSAESVNGDRTIIGDKVRAVNTGNSESGFGQFQCTCCINAQLLNINGRTADFHCGTFIQLNIIAGTDCNINIRINDVDSGTFGNHCGDLCIF